MVRKPEHVTKLSEKGVTGILFEGLDDLSAIRKAAGDNDGIVALNYPPWKMSGKNERFD